MGQNGSNNNNNGREDQKQAIGKHRPKSSEKQKIRSSITQVHDKVTRKQKQKTWKTLDKLIENGDIPSLGLGLSAKKKTIAALELSEMLLNAMERKCAEGDEQNSLSVADDYHKDPNYEEVDSYSDSSSEISTTNDKKLINKDKKKKAKT